MLNIHRERKPIITLPAAGLIPFSACNIKKLDEGHEAIQQITVACIDALGTSISCLLGYIKITLGYSYIYIYIQS